MRNNNMKRVWIYFLLFPVCWVARAESLFDPATLYQITSLDTKSGGIVQGSQQDEYPLMYDAGVAENTATALWAIKEEESDKYSLKNSETNQYIAYAPANDADKYVFMTNELQGNATLFTVESKKNENGITYWAIKPVDNQGVAFDRRSYNAVGPYQANYTDNQLFSFKAKGGAFVEAPPPVYGFSDYLNAFTLDNMTPAYDKRSECYYFSIALDALDGDLTKIVSFTPKDATYTVKIDGKEIVSGQEYTFDKVTANKRYTIQVVRNNQTLSSVPLIFTGLPIVQLYSDGNALSSNFSKGKIRVQEGAKTNTQTGELLNAEMRYRGASALGFEKKSFAVKLRNADWESADRSFFGLRNDNYWILDAMAVDGSRMRNRVSMDLWNEFSADPYFKALEPEMVNGTRGHYVEVFLDDEYWGLYCMSERIDRKQLKLKKYEEDTQNIRGVLYKASQWSKAVLMGSPYYTGANNVITDYYNWSETWDCFEVKYPDMEEGEPIDWNPLYEVVTFVANSNNAAFTNGISQVVDIPVWLDYYLLMELILASDNHGKNAYYYMYNINQEQKMGIAPWDMDGVFGIQWGGNKIAPEQDYTAYLRAKEWSENYLYRRLKDNNVAGYNDRVKSRYDALRSTYFSADQLIRRFENYRELFENTGADVRERDRWNGANGISVNFQDELGYITDWIVSRTSYLNEAYGPPDVGIDQLDELTDTLEVYPNPVITTLNIKGIVSGTPYAIYSGTGICVDKGWASSPFSLDFSAYMPGTYYLKVGKTGKVILKK